MPGMRPPGSSGQHNARACHLCRGAPRPFLSPQPCSLAGENRLGSADPRIPGSLPGSCLDRHGPAVTDDPRTPGPQDVIDPWSPLVPLVPLVPSLMPDTVSDTVPSST
jgi:hypothetical protein